MSSFTPREECLLRALTLALSSMNESIEHLKGCIRPNAGLRGSGRYYLSAAKDLAEMYRKTQLEISDLLSFHNINQERTDS